MSTMSLIFLHSLNSYKFLHFYYCLLLVRLYLKPITTSLYKSLIYVQEIK